MYKFKSPEKLLAHMSEQYKDFMIAPIDLEKICSVYDIKITEKFLSESTIGKIFIENQKTVILVNTDQNGSRCRKRFTIAHELGHYFLHLNDEKTSFIDNRKTMSRTESYWTPVEAQANDFAARLLMPFDLIITQAEKLVNEVEMEESEFIKKMADIFEVSKQAMTYRLKNIGII